LHFIEKEVIKLIKKYKTNDPYEICDKRGIEWKHVNMHEDINGIYQNVERNKFIYINDILTIPGKRIACCHELGHTVLHENHNCIFLKTNTLFSLNKFEIEAETFVAFMHIRDLNDILKYKGASLEEISYELGIPKEYIQLRLKYSGINFKNSSPYNNKPNISLLR
jgi:Zn-dependent peptidase ImmA (M78 family)